jgi:hypothetical protein
MPWLARACAVAATLPADEIVTSHHAQIMITR